MASSFFKPAAAAICLISSTRRTSLGSSASLRRASLTVSLSRLGKAHLRHLSHSLIFCTLMLGNAVGQPGELRDRLGQLT